MSWLDYVPSLNFSMSSVFGGNEATQQTQPPQPSFRERLRARFGSGMTPGNAFRQLRQDPRRFMRYHEVNVQGKYGDPSGSSDAFFIAEHDPIATRRSSIDGSEQPVYRYHLMPKTAYKFWTLKKRPSHSHSKHKVQHIAMEHTVPDENDGSPVQQGHKGRGATFAHIPQGHESVFATNKVDKCTIKRSNSVISHNLPLQSWGTSDDFTQRGGGYDLEQGLLQQDLSALTYGPSTYRRPHRGRAVSLFIQSSRRGSLNIYGQGVTPGWDEQPNPQWNPTLTHHRMAPPTAMEIRRAVRARLARKRRNALSLSQNPEKLQKAQSRFVASIDHVAEKMRKQLGMG